MKTRVASCVLTLALTAANAASDPNPDPLILPLVTGSHPSIDGRVATGEYAATFTDAKTGIKVSWQADAANVYVALESAHGGWVAMGLGARGMRGASMVLGFTNKQKRWVVEEQAGKSFYRHSVVEDPKLMAGVAGPVSGKTVLEFALPRALSNGQTVTADEPLPFLLAMHKSKTKLSKHSKAASAVLVLRELPRAR